MDVNCALYVYTATFQSTKMKKPALKTVWFKIFFGNPLGEMFYRQKVQLSVSLRAFL